MIPLFSNSDLVVKAGAPVFAGFLGADWWGSDATAMAGEFRRRGHLLVERHYEDWLSTKWRKRVLKVARRVLRPWMVREYNEAVSELLDVEALDFLLVFKGMLLLPETLARFRQARVPCYCFYPDVSFTDHGENIRKCLPLYDCVFSTKSFHLEDESLRKTVRRLEFASHGFDPHVHRPVNVTERMRRIYGCDVSFVGCWSRKKDAVLRELLVGKPGIDMKVWGPAWGRASAEVRAAWQGRGAYGDELAVIYACSRINLGLLSEAGGGTATGDATTARTWQIPASGGFLLHEDTPEVRKYFAASREIALFRDTGEMIDRVRYYLHHEEERWALAAAGRERATAAPYSYGPAVDRILAVHRELIEGQPLREGR